nr:PaaX family transcriptional regulator C-terminal domain-containing protein [Micromonospora sp. DSM 115978]
MWITPRPVGASAQQMFDELGVVSSTVLTAATQPSPTDPRPPIAAWDLTDLRVRYEEFIARSLPLLDRVRTGDVSGAEALVARTALMDAWRRFPALDPDLPLDLLPRQWPRAEARALFAEIYDGLAPAAVDRVRTLLATVSPDLAPLVQLHRTPAA